MSTLHYPEFHRKEEKKEEAGLYLPTPAVS